MDQDVASRRQRATNPGRREPWGLNLGNPVELPRPGFQTANADAHDGKAGKGGQPAPWAATTASPCWSIQGWERVMIRYD
ncbi:hypothetical protein GX51_02236 [Blastomyces parvus]|uniref:Uncharacterized protein n=1 Tax=Blastomyces parvus TaxID=2060905 RepID=A0A2B7XCG6_9EURO|nr:hypothetical protein GX51_02236 [Blastomyces parvus]